MGLIRRSFNILSLGLVRGRSRKQRVAAKQLRAQREATGLLRQHFKQDPRFRNYGSGHDPFQR
jgi:hypothetical protein